MPAIYLESKSDYHTLFRILDDTEIYFTVQPLIKFSIELVTTILQHIHNEIRPGYRPARELLHKIISRYPDILSKVFKENLTEEQKILLIYSALRGHVKANPEIEQYIKTNDKRIILSLQEIYKVDSEEMRKIIDDSLGINPSISPRRKRR